VHFALASPDDADWHPKEESAWSFGWGKYSRIIFQSTFTIKMCDGTTIVSV